MRIIDLLNRIVWDKSLNKSDFFVEILDRLAGPRRVSFQEISRVGGFLSIKGSEIPLHRVTRVYWRNLPIFDRLWARDVRSKANGLASRVGTSCGEWQFEVLPTSEYGCPEYSSLGVGPVIVVNEVVDCPRFSTYYLAGSPLFPAYVCQQ